MGASSRRPSLWKWRLGLRGIVWAGALVFATFSACAQSSFSLERIGFYDAAHTRTDGYQNSVLFALTDAGRAFGYSYRYSGSSLLGATLWVETAGTAPIALGLYDAEHTRADGSFSISMAEITESGLTRGASGRFSGGTVSLGQTAWATTAAGATHGVGFYDAEHTGSGGFQSSEALDLNEAGDLRGVSLRYGSGGEDRGQTAWVATVDGTTTRVGLVASPEFERNDGFRYSTVDFLNAGGITAGSSTRYAGGADDLGDAAWIANRAGTTTRVGLFSAGEFQRADGYASSTVQELTDSGRTRGYSERFSGSTAVGRAAWVADLGGAVTRVGMTDAEHTRADGFQQSMVEGIVESGLTRGYSQRFAGGSTDLGYTAWVANGAGSTFEVGYYDATHTRADGYQSSLTGAINEAGVVVGVSNRYAGSDSLGRSAWRAAFNGTSAPATVRIGLIDAEHTALDGSQTSTPEILTESGIVGGSSSRYGGGEIYLGQSAWISPSDATTTRVGLTTAEFTRADGWKFSAIDAISESGKIAGFSSRYNGGSADLGQAAWVATLGGSTQRVGLTDARHTAGNGTQFSEVTKLTESGYAAGWSDRYEAAVEVGQTAWVFDINASVLTPFVFSTRASDGYAYSEVISLLENGWTLGTYTLFDGAGVDLGNRAFVWMPGGTAFDLGSNIEGGLSAADFANLLASSDGTLSGLVAGSGTPLSNSGQAVYLAQAVPEPSPVALLVVAGGILAMVFLRRRRAPRSALPLLSADR